MFPDTPYVRERERYVVPVHDCPKPPPERISLTLPAIQAAREVWVLASGDGKAEVVGKALSGATPDEIPAAGAVGQERTLWLLDRDAAGELNSER
jgi:6-phosphogluconolactonase